jgi:hypothetical protein
VNVLKDMLRGNKTTRAAIGENRNPITPETRKPGVPSKTTTDSSAPIFSAINSFLSTAHELRSWKVEKTSAVDRIDIYTEEGKSSLQKLLDIPQVKPGVTPQ